MKIRNLIVILLVGILIFTGCSKKEEPGKENTGETQEPVEETPVVSDPMKEEPVPDVVASVNGVNIAGDYFKKNMKLIEYQYKLAYGQEIFTTSKDQELYSTIQNNLVRTLINDLLIRDFNTQRDIVVKEDEVEAMLANFKKAVEADENYKKYLEDNKIDDAFLRKVIENQLNTSHAVAYIKNMISQDPTMLENLDKEVLEVKAAHILVKEEEEARKLYEELKENPAKFGEKAKEVSIDTGSKDSGGDLGYFKYETMIPDFSKAAFSATVGEVTEPVATVHGYHLILVEDRKTFGDIKESGTLDKAAIDAMENSLVEKESFRRYQAVVDELFHDGSITVHEFGQK